jgi:hypothetical protein
MGIQKLKQNKELKTSNMMKSYKNKALNLF